MSSKPTPTPGPCVVLAPSLPKQSVAAWICTVGGNYGDPAVFSTALGPDGQYIFGDKLADANLIAEAFTVHHETGLTPQQLRERMERAEKQRDELLTALKAIVAIEAVPFDFPADWDAQIAGCSECQRYKDHPIQKGICDNHRKPLYARKRHEDDQQATLIYRAKDAARAAIASVEAAS